MWGNAAYVFHVGAWGLWLAGAMLFALSTRNPFYLGLLVVVALVVNRALNRYAERRDTGQAGGDAGSGQRSGGVLLRAVVLISLAVALFKGMSLHLGATVLFTLPEWIPVLGGPVTLEALASSGLDALTIQAGYNAMDAVLAAGAALVSGSTRSSCAPASAYSRAFSGVIFPAHSIATELDNSRASATNRAKSDTLTFSITITSAAAATASLISFSFDTSTATLCR